MNVIPPPERTLRTGAALERAGLVVDADAADTVAARYAVAVTPHIAALIDPDDPDDPIARQFLPDPAELETTPDELADPIGDKVHSPVPGVVHRYPDRALLLPTLICPVYCRFCFRREVVGGPGGVLTADELDAALGYIAATVGIREVILSGGDPLSLSDRRLGDILERLDAIPHVESIRIHTRVPVADPARITPELAAILARGKPLFLVVHCNHARELAPATQHALATLSRAGIPLLSQTVLLKGVNDDAATMEALLRALLRCRVKPYYLHHADLAPGTARFRTSVEAGRALMRELRGRLSGLCLPSYVLDIPGGHGKAPLGPDEWDDGEGSITGWRGDDHAYPEPPEA